VQRDLTPWHEGHCKGGGAQQRQSCTPALARATATARRHGYPFIGCHSLVPARNTNEYVISNNIKGDLL
jgi:hypothetical protein